MPASSKGYGRYRATPTLLRPSGVGLLPGLAQWSPVEQRERNGHDEQ